MNATQANEWLREQALIYGVPLRPDGRIGQALVVALLDRCDYVVGPGTFAEFERKGYFQTPGTGIWTGEEVHRFRGVLDFFRRWKKTPSAHDAKKSKARLLIETEGNAVLEDLGGRTVEILLLNLVHATDDDTRELLYEAILNRMDESGFIEE